MTAMSSRSPRAMSLALLVLLLGLAPEIRGLRILGMFPLNGKSHFVMCESLMRGLAERGHQVDVYSHFPLKKPLPNYTDYSLSDTSIPKFVNNLSFDFINDMTDKPSVSKLLKMLGLPICKMLEKSVVQKLIKNPPTDPAYDVVIVEAFAANCVYAFGRHLNIPMVSVVTTPPFDWQNAPMGNPVNYAVDKSGMVARVPETFLERLENWYVGTKSELAFNYYAKEQDELVRRLFGQDFPDVVELQKDISLMLTNYHQALNGIRPFVPAVVPVGGLHVVDPGHELPQDVKKFLDESKNGFIYFSFGSMVRIETLPQPVLREIYSSFEKIAPVRVLMKIAKPEVLPPGLPSNVITNSWLPQLKVLAHKNIKGFITHGGLMGTQEAIYYGVPMIGFPIFGDQQSNIESYVEKKLAIQLDRRNIKEETLTKAILEILQNPVYKKTAEKASKLFRDNPMTPLDTAIFWVEYVARHGKHSLQSPIVHMPWWQANLIDVYGFIGAVLFAVLYCIRVIFKVTCGFLSKKPKSTKSKIN